MTSTKTRKIESGTSFEVSPMWHHFLQKEWTSTIIYLKLKKRGREETEFSAKKQWQTTKRHHKKKETRCTTKKNTQQKKTGNLKQKKEGVSASFWEKWHIVLTKRLAPMKMSQIEAKKQH